ncbi:GntR family transcriptional regulator [Bradyrhizobium jicamae]|uniref:GntR family transcriptional regulator n=1 Tax=Bradyrhizobium jicamae TaxID=280332 RepID=A0A0R3LB50_9BRAD|nr:GntR family transcriptional regulator [Bradyrhizobium jicamae]KRR02048.1 GntR family transcriptional regulator [Bradyrhizobium jicamae]
MSQVQGQLTLVEQVVNAIVSEIVDGELPSNSRLIQDELARAYGVSRQPIQQALLLLRDRGLVREAPGRGLIVSPIDPDFVRKLYEVRAMLDGLAARLAAERGAARARTEGSAYLEAGRAAVESGSLNEQIEADMKFHAFINELSENTLIGETTAPHWPYLRRVMGEVLRDDAQMPQIILGEHVAILDAIVAGDGDRAEALSRDHIARAAKIFVQRLQAQKAASEQEMRQRRTRRIR